MDKEFIQGSNYYVADSMNCEPTVSIDNFVDVNDGGFKLSTTVDFDTHIMIVENTIVRCYNENGEKSESPDYKIIEINRLDKKIKVYKVELCGARDFTEKEAETYCIDNEAILAEA